MKPVLMVAYHYPPEASSSGMLRTLKFSKYLPQHGWAPHVLTLRESLYPLRDDSLLADIPSSVTVHRTRALDASRHLAVRGRHLAMLGVPDRFVSWLPFGVTRGLRVVRKVGVRALYSTSPQPTAHLIALLLRRATGLPWIADFRDPWIEEGQYPRPGSLRYRVESALEALVVRRATRVTVTTEHFRRDLLARYPDLASDRVVTVFNGYDEDDFTGLDAIAPGGVFDIAHTGSITPEFRDPFPLLRAVAACIDRGLMDRADVQLTFIGGGSWASSPKFAAAAAGLGLAREVRVMDRVTYRASLAQLARSAVLLLLQASDDTRALIPAKAFEYVRSGRPVLALTREGATAELVRSLDAGLVVDPRDTGALETAVAALYRRWKMAPGAPAVVPRGITRFHRSALTGELAAVLEHAVPRPLTAALAQESTLDEQQAGAARRSTC
jgi:glycosyltransferase involved in cell wall biosynthesis